MAISFADVKSNLNEVCASAPDVKIDANLLDEAIKGAMLRIASYIDLPALQQSETLAVTSGNHTFDFYPPGDFDRIMVITFIGADDTRGALSEDNDRAIEVAIRVENTTGTPDRYALWGNRLKTYPILNQNGTYYIDWLAKITGENDIDEKYFKLFCTMAKLDIYKEGSIEWQAAFRDMEHQLQRLKPQQNPYKAHVEITNYRGGRLANINSL